MRISDWSSDVCSSDLSFSLFRREGCLDRRKRYRLLSCRRSGHFAPAHGRTEAMAICRQAAQRGDRGVPAAAAWFFRWRSEEHTSELQSLMRISYAVLCLKKKTQKLTQHHVYRKFLHKQNVTNTITKHPLQHNQSNTTHTL